MNDLLLEQIAYYRARAPEYDEWFLRRGRYDRGPEEAARWQAEVAVVEAALERCGPRGQVLELACGTGWWTARLARWAARLTALDSAPEALALNRARLAGAANVDYEEADLFAWRPPRRYDVVFFSFWLSHVPPERFTAFWDLVRAALAPGGRVFFVDSLYNEGATAVDHRLEGALATGLTRRLNDGREFRIVKVFYDPSALQQHLAGLGWQMAVQSTGSHLLYGEGRPLLATAAPGDERAGAAGGEEPS